jgi:hypothetical protein
MTWERNETIGERRMPIIAWDGERVGEAFWSKRGWIMLSNLTGTQDAQRPITHWMPMPGRPAAGSGQAAQPGRA